MSKLDSIHNPPWNFLKLQVFCYVSICKVCLRAFRSDQPSRRFPNHPQPPYRPHILISLSLQAVLIQSTAVSLPSFLFIYLVIFFLTSLLITWNLHHGGEHATVPSKKEIYLKFPPFHPSLGLSILLILPPINARNHGWQEWGQWRGREGRRNTERGGREERKCRHNLLQKV